MRYRLFFVFAALLSLGLTTPACSNGGDNNGNNQNGGNNGAGDAETDTTADTGDEDATDVAEDDAADTSCTGTYIENGTEQCCAKVDCSVVDFSAPEPQTGFDPATDVLTMHIDGEATKVESASVLATVGTFSGMTASGRNVNVEGTVDGDTVTFDFSEVEVPSGEEFRLDNITLEDACGQSGTLTFSQILDLDGSSTVTEFDCELQNLPF